ncbi:hypothetical protein ABI59_05380 [Acidobacteria bacterium Mor1]|nr:hypothetical protein ABI59_05380 [Acidobacteria bacterium Mor1]
MIRHPSAALLICAIGFLTWGCGGSGSDGAAGSMPLALPAPETFDWSAAPARFSPPGGDWERQRVQSAGLQGVRFLRSGSFITVAEYTSLMTRHARIGERGRVDFDVPRPGFTIAEVVDRVRFDPEAKPPWVKIRDLRDGRHEVDGRSARAVDYIWDDKGKTKQGREYYVVSRGHLYVARFRGSLEDLALFEQVVESLEFPEPVEDAAWRR